MSADSGEDLFRSAQNSDSVQPLSDAESDDEPIFALKHKHESSEDDSEDAPIAKKSKKAASSEG
jgi:hypothetical protein